jgi:hypothetical protein
MLSGSLSRKTAYRPRTGIDAIEATIEALFPFPHSGSVAPI